MKESELQQQVADYLRLQYPNVLFHSDYGSGVKLTARQAAAQKRQNGGLRGYPDLFICEPAPCYDNGNFKNEYHGLFIELKREGARLRKKSGDFTSKHIEEQFEFLMKLTERGYKAVFAVGFDEAKEAIDEYLKLTEHNRGSEVIF